VKRARRSLDPTSHPLDLCVAARWVVHGGDSRKPPHAAVRAVQQQRAEALAAMQVGRLFLAKDRAANDGREFRPVEIMVVAGERVTAKELAMWPRPKVQVPLQSVLRFMGLELAVAVGAADRPALVHTEGPDMGAPVDGQLTADGRVDPTFMGVDPGTGDVTVMAQVRQGDDGKLVVTGEMTAHFPEVLQGEPEQSSQPAGWAGAWERIGSPGA
jgi:hypothetical protein